MPPNRTTLAVLLAVLVVGSGFTIAGPATAQTAGNAPTSENLTIVSLSAPDSAAANDTVTVSATVENAGETETTELVEFRVAGSVADRQYVTVGPNERATVSLEADTTGIEPGEYIHGVLTETDGAFATLTVSESFTVDSVDVPANASSGTSITATATITNPNDVNATQTVAYRFAGGLLTEQTLTLGPGETANVSVDANLAGIAPGTYIHGVFTRDSGQVLPITITEMTGESEPATVTFTDQQSDGMSVVVDSLTLPRGGFVTIHDASLLEGNVVGSVIGVSDALEDGTYENVTVPLFTVPGGPSEANLTANATLIAMPHLDTNGNDIYDFVTSGGMDDGPYLVNGSAVTDAANITIGAEMPADGTETPDNETEMPDNETEMPDNETETPGEATPSEETPTAGETPTEETPTEDTPTETPLGTATPASITALEALLPGPF